KDGNEDCDCTGLGRIAIRFGAIGILMQRSAMQNHKQNQNTDANRLASPATPHCAVRCGGSVSVVRQERALAHIPLGVCTGPGLWPHRARLGFLALSTSTRAQGMQITAISSDAIGASAPSS